MTTTVTISAHRVERSVRSLIHSDLTMRGNVRCASTGTDGAVGRGRVHVEIHVALREHAGIATSVAHAR
jgi:phage gp45-like